MMNRRKKRQTEDVIKMRMGQKYFCIEMILSLPVAAQAVTQFPDTGSGINNYQPTLSLKPYLQAQGVSAIFNRFGSRAWNRASDPPEFNFHNNNGLSFLNDF